MQLTETSWGFCLIVFLPKLATGDNGNCSDFLHIRPSLPLLQLLSFTTQSPCGHLFHIHACLPRRVWDPEMPTVVVVPGKRSPSSVPTWVRRMCQELVTVGQRNVLAVDWLVPADVDLIKAAEMMGRKLAQNIRSLQVMRSDLDMFHLIGFGVGAHIAGIAGSNLNGSIGRITGLDPFAPVFSQADHSVRLDKADGQYVDVIHTSFNPTEPLPALGFGTALGHVDFYVDKGYQLPGCPHGLNNGEEYLLCSHRRAHQIFTSSIQNVCRHFAFPCQSITDFQSANCAKCDVPGINGCPEMGFDISWLPAHRPVPFEPLTVILTIAPAPPYCVTPLLLELNLGGNLSVKAKLLVQLKGQANKTSYILVSGHSMTEFVGGKTYQFMVSATNIKHLQTISLEFNTELLLYHEWRKRKVAIHHLLLSYLPTQKRIAYQAWNFTAVENQRTEVVLQRIFKQED